MIWILILIWLFVTSLVAGPQEELFLQACTFYKNGEFHKALENFQKIEPKNSAVWYNMGNCAYLCNDMTQAYICWKKAERHAPTHIKNLIDKNVAVFLEKFGKHDHESLLAGFLQDVYTMLAKIPDGIVQLLFLFVWYVALALISMRKKISYVMCILLGMAVIGFASLVIMHYYAEERLEGIICKDETPLYAGPDDRYHMIGSLNHLDTIRVYQRIGSWCKVGNRSCTGWTPADSIELV